MDYKDIEKEFEEVIKIIRNRFDFTYNAGATDKGDYLVRAKNNTEEDLKEYLKAKILQVIDDMIGEEIDIKIGNIEGNEENSYRNGQVNGYTQKVSELKEYKKRFNE